MLNRELYVLLKTILDRKCQFALLFNHMIDCLWLSHIMCTVKVGISVKGQFSCIFQLSETNNELLMTQDVSKSVTGLVAQSFV